MDFLHRVEDFKHPNKNSVPDGGGETVQMAEGVLGFPNCIPIEYLVFAIGFRSWGFEISLAKEVQTQEIIFVFLSQICVALY